MDKSTKYCEITVHLKTGVRIAGMLHVPLRTSSAIRPSDAIRESDGFMLLSNATVWETGQSRLQAALLVRLDAISHIDLPEKGWVAREVADVIQVPGYLSRQTTE